MLVKIFSLLILLVGISDSAISDDRISMAEAESLKLKVKELEQKIEALEREANKAPQKPQLQPHSPLHPYPTITKLRLQLQN